MKEITSYSSNNGEQFQNISTFRNTITQWIRKNAISWVDEIRQDV